VALAAGPDPLARAAQAVSACRTEAGRWARALRSLCAEPDSAASNLTAIGDPVELQCVWDLDSGRTAIRATLDPAPSAPPALRMARATRAVTGLSPAQAALRDRLRALPAHRFGGWIGLRDAGRGRKLYVEVPARAPWRDWPELAAAAGPPLPVRAFAPMLLGLDPGSGGSEVYGGIAPLVAVALGPTLRALGLPDRSGDMLHLIGDLAERRISARLPGADQGLSIAVAATGEPRALTWYTHAEALIGPDVAGRPRLLRFGRQHGLDLTAYRRLSAPRPNGAVPFHGVIGVSADRGGALALSVTCATRPAAEVP
jgi:hypothetical protein